MIELNKKQFQEKFKKEEINVFCFYKPDCIVCDQYFERLGKHGISDAFNKVNIDEDIIYFKTELGLWILPDTRIYYKENIIWTCGGILYDTQMKYLIGVLQGDENAKEI